MGGSLPGEAHRMQRVARRETVTVERRCGLADSLVSDEGPLAYQQPLEKRVEHHAEETRESHGNGRLHRARAVQHRQREYQYIPHDAIAEADALMEDAAGPGAMRAADEQVAHAVPGGVDPSDDGVQARHRHVPDVVRWEGGGVEAYSHAKAVVKGMAEL